MDKIVCVGKNYSEHAKELGDLVPEKPVIFIKPPSVLKRAVSNQSLEVSLPKSRGQVHHECEIVLKIKKGGFNMTLQEAESAIGEVTLGLDMTLRDLQTKLKKSGSPWTVAKVFPDSAIIGPWVTVEEFREYLETPFSFEVNGVTKQRAVASEMTLSPRECVAYISTQFPLCEGDLIFTGTPKGVGPVVGGDKGVLTFGPIQYGVVWHES